MAKSRQQLIQGSSFLKNEKEKVGGLNVKRSTITADSFKKGTSQESSDNIEGRVTANEKKITLLKNIVKLRKQNVDKQLKPEAEQDKSQQMGSPLLESLQSIASTVDSIRDTLIQQQDNDKGVTESMRREREEKDRQSQEKKLEKPKLLQKFADPIIKPVMSIWSKILNFIKTLFLGKILMNFIDWFGNPANQGKIITLVRFVKDWWPALTAAVLLFGTGFGGLVAGLIGTITFFIGAMGKAIVALKSAKFMKMIPGGGKIGAIAKVVAPLALAGGVGYGIGRMQGGDDQQEQPQGFNKGGQVPGSGPNKDTVPAMLTPGEFVMSRGAVEQYGVDTLEGMNAAAGGTNIPTLKKVEVPQYNEGGMIMQEDLIEVNKERALQGLPPLEQLIGYDNLPKAKGPGEKTQESTDVFTNLETMMRTITKTVNGKTATEKYKLSNEEATALLKKKGLPSMELADGSIVVDSAAFNYDRGIEQLASWRARMTEENPKVLAEFNALPDVIAMDQGIADGSLREEFMSSARMHKSGTKENLMQKNMNRIEEMDGGEGVKLMNYNGGGLVPHFMGGGIVNNAATQSMGMEGGVFNNMFNNTLGYQGGGLVQGFQGGGIVLRQTPMQQMSELREERLNILRRQVNGKFASNDDKKRYKYLTKKLNFLKAEIKAGQRSTPTSKVTPTPTQTPVTEKKKGGGLFGGLKRVVGGTADQLTGNLFDFDKKSGGGLIRKTAGAVGGLFGGGKKEGGSKGGSKGGSSGILGPISSNVDAMVNTDKYEVKPKEKKNTVVAYEQAVNEQQQQNQQGEGGGNEIPQFTLRPSFMIDPAKVDVLGIVV